MPSKSILKEISNSYDVASKMTRSKNSAPKIPSIELQSKKVSKKNSTEDIIEETKSIPKKETKKRKETDEDFISPSDQTSKKKKSAATTPKASKKKNKPTAAPRTTKNKNKENDVLIPEDQLVEDEISKNLPLKIGYPCVHWTNGWTTNRNFKKVSHTKEKLYDCITQNLADLEKMLHWNIKEGIYFFRVGSLMVPFASHPDFKTKYDWITDFKSRFTEIGDFIKKYGIRISMHPDQFVVLNSLTPTIVSKSIDELDYHCSILDALELDKTHKVQLHVGGVFGDKEAAIERFSDVYEKLSNKIKDRLVIENDDRSYSLKDCLEISEKTGVPILFDNLHHECLNNGEELRSSVIAASKTWKESDGVPMMDYSSQEPGAKKGKHSSTIDLIHFAEYSSKIQGIRADVILEIKDKEDSAMKAISHLKQQQKAKDSV